MERDNDTIEFVELGSVSTETQGIEGPKTDAQVGFNLGGISDE